MMKFDSTHGLLKENINDYQEVVTKLHQVIHEKTGAGNDYLGWVDWPLTYDKEEFDRIVKLAKKLESDRKSVV